MLYKDMAYTKEMGKELGYGVKYLALLISISLLRIMGNNASEAVRKIS